MPIRRLSSRPYLRGLCAGSLLLFAGVASAQEPARRSFADLVAIADASDVEYQIETVAPDSAAGREIVERLGGQPGEIVQFPRLERSENGGIALREWRCQGEARLVLAEAEAAFTEQDFVTARQAYLRTLELDPECYMAHAHIGDTFFREDNPAAAIGPYSRAIELNPLDHRSFSYRGHAYLRLGQGDKALADFQTALTLRPHYFLIASLIQHYREFAVSFHDLRFVPPVALERTRGATGEIDRVAVTLVGRPESSADTASVLPYALCRAVWLGEGLNYESTEPQSRKRAPGEGEQGAAERTRKRVEKSGRGTKKPVETPSADPAEASESSSEQEVPDTGSFFDAREEAECLLAAIEGREPGADPALDRLAEAVDAGFLEEAVIYGIGAQRFGQLPLMMSEDARQRLHEYVARFVLLPAEATPEGPADVGAQAQR